MKPFSEILYGQLFGMMRWEQWDGVRSVLQADANIDWYVYCVGHALPEAPVRGKEFVRMLGEIDALLRRDHQESYLGIVYADDLDDPTFVKIYDPNNLGSSCGSSGYTIPPGWTISRMPPEEIRIAAPLPMGRSRWWTSIAGWISGKDTPSPGAVQ